MNKTFETFSSQNIPTNTENSQLQLTTNDIKSIGAEDFKNPQFAKIQLPDNFFAELEKIENFFDTYLKELIPNLVGEIKLNGETSHPIEMNRTQANSSELVG